MKPGWISATLGEAFITSTGSTPPKSNSGFYGQFMPLVKPPELLDSTLDSAEDGLSEAGAQVARTLPANSILVSCIGNLGKIGMNTVPVAFNQQINAIHPAPGKALPEFMFYQTLGGRFREQLEALASGTTVPIVNKSKFNSIEIVLPPLTEQQRIVTLLDEAFDGIATAKAHAEKNLQNARAIFESHLDAVLSRNGAGDTATTLGAEVDLLPGYAFPSGGYTDAIDAVRLLRGDNIMQGYFRWEEAKGWPSGDCESYSRFSLWSCPFTPDRILFCQRS
jgi:type I restriction enzyme S subunit